MIIDIQQAEGIVLDYLVSKAKGRGLGALEGDLLDLRIRQGIKPLPYSTDWSVGGPVYSAAFISCSIEEEDGIGWRCFAKGGIAFYGDTELKAKARCYVSNVLSNGHWTAEVPLALIEVYEKQ